MSISNLPVGDESPKEESQPDSSVPLQETTSESSAVSEEENPSSAPVAESKEEISPAPTAQLSVNEKPLYEQITDALLGRIKNPGASATFKLCLYGPPGGTKSSFLGQIPNNLVYDQEDGVISMATQEFYTGKPMAPGVKALPFKSFAESEMLMERLAADDEAFQQWTVFSIDTFSDFNRKAQADMMAQYKKQMGSAFNQYKMETEHHAESNLRMLEYIRMLRGLNKDIVVTAHSRTVEPKGKPAKTYPDFSESFAQKMEAMMDVVGYMEMMTVEEGKPPMPVLRVISDGTVHAKTRIPLPAVIVNPNWQDMKNVWVEWKAKIDAQEQV